MYPNGSFHYQVESREGQVIGPEKAKIVINPAANRPRLLFKDDETGEWVEPESYYFLGSEAFYEKERNVYRDDEAGLTVEPIKASAWHGVPTIAYKFVTGENKLLFSADTVYRPALWKQLCEEYRPQRFESIGREEFERSSVLFGDINDFIERTWSRERYENAISAYEGSVVVHDVARKNSIVHTDYADISDAPIDKLLFTHNPDNLTAFRPILKSNRKLVFRHGEIYESVKGKLYAFDADVYIHHFSCDLVGYRSETGDYKVIEKEGLLGIVRTDEPGEGLRRVDLYQDIGGEYFPHLTDQSRSYLVREDGQVEEVTRVGSTSRGRIVENLRGEISGRPAGG